VYGFIDDQVEAIPPEEATSRNSYIVADVALSLAMQITDWKEDSAPQLEFHEFMFLGSYRRGVWVQMKLQT
jgi:hypothetical protein